MLINVTPEDITRGVRLSACSCPIALAIKRTTTDSASVTDHTIYIGTRHFATPQSVRRFIEYFDDARPVYPFTFILPTE